MIMTEKTAALIASIAAISTGVYNALPTQKGVPWKIPPISIKGAGGSVVKIYAPIALGVVTLVAKKKVLGKHEDLILAALLIFVGGNALFRAYKTAGKFEANQDTLAAAVPLAAGATLAAVVAA